jgi:hypothetical protein
VLLHPKSSSSSVLHPKPAQWSVLVHPRARSVLVDQKSPSSTVPFHTERLSLNILLLSKTLIERIFSSKALRLTSRLDLRVSCAQYNRNSDCCSGDSGVPDAAHTQPRSLQSSQSVGESLAISKEVPNPQRRDHGEWLIWHWQIWWKSTQWSVLTKFRQIGITWFLPNGSKGRYCLDLKKIRSGQSGNNECLAFFIYQLIYLTL